MLTPLLRRVAIAAAVATTTGNAVAREPAPQQQREPEPPRGGESKPVRVPKPVAHRAADEHGEPEVGLFPVATYAPETELGLGALAIVFFPPSPDDPREHRTTSLALLGLYTLREQAILELQPNLYWNDEGWHWWSKIEYQKFPDRFFGIGNDTLLSAEESYERRFLRGRTRIMHRLLSKLHVGVIGDVQRFEATYPDPDGTFATTDVLGEPGGLTVGFGFALQWDSRDHEVAPREGGYYEATWLRNSRTLGSDYGFSTITADVRRFLPLGAAHVLATRLYGEFHYGAVPYYRTGQLGGADLLRGYFRGRYRNEVLTTTELEYRTPMVGIFGAAAFAGIGRVAPRVSALSFEDWHPAGGVGGRVALNGSERLNLRIDAGAGTDQWGIYVGAGEIF